MVFERGEFKQSLRDRLITRAQYGEITPAQAEAEAAANGLAAFERTPDLPQFDPRLESRWSIVMALAWIAWRDFESVREQVPEFRAESTYWIFREWNEPVNNGTEFALRKGWFLETWCRPTTFLLTMRQIHASSEKERPSTARMTIREAEAALWQALSDEHLWAEGFDAQGKVTRIPSMEWAHLKLFEDGKQDVFRYNALDRSEPYTEVRFKRDDLFRLWQAWPVEAYMIEPMTRPTSAGYVPLSSALLWICTRAGAATMDLENVQAWDESVAQLLPLISTGEIEVLGKLNSKGPPAKIPNHYFAAMNVAHPLSEIRFLFSDDPWIGCTTFVDLEHWNGDDNDKMFLEKSGPATWTHLQVKKSDVLREFSSLVPSISPAKSTTKLPGLQTRILEVANELWPARKPPSRVKERDQKVPASRKPSKRTYNPASP
jgi:hypothetical protein